MKIDLEIEIELQIIYYRVTKLQGYNTLKTFL